jgi:hypothetical protein
MNPPVYTLLLADARVVALVGDRVYPHGEAPAGVATPYVTWFEVNGQPFNSMDSRPDRDRDTVQIDCWSGQDDPNTCRTLARLVLDVLEDRAHCTGQPIDGRDRETKNWRKALQFDFLTKRPGSVSG